MENEPSFPQQSGRNLSPKWKGGKKLKEDENAEKV